MDARKWRVRGFLGLLAVLILAGLCACRKPPAVVIPPQPVEYAAAVARDVPFYIETFGNCVTIASVTIQPQVTGILMETLFREGADVRKGDVIFRIDPAVYAAALAQADGNLTSAQGALALAQQNLDRQKKLYETKVSSIQDFQAAQANAQEAQGNLMASQAVLNQAKINLDYCTISSPIEGKAGAYLIDTGNLVTANQSKLVNIRTLNPIYVDYTISENQLVSVRDYLDEDGLDVEIRIPGQDDAVAIGKLTFMDNNVASDTGTLKLRARVRNESQRLWPGQFVNVRLILTIIPNAIIVPSSSIVVGQSGSFVYVIDEDANGGATVTLRPVKTGQLQRADRVVSEGLAAGERVVTSGQIGLFNGKAVRLGSPRGSASPSQQGMLPQPSPSASPAPSR